MGTKMTKCKVCQADIAANAKVCPQCGAKNKKPIFKKWWFWSLIIIVVIVVAATSSGGGDTKTSSQPSPNSSVSASESVAQAAAEKYKLIAENDEPPFTISEKSIAFINEHKDFFPGNSDNKGAISDYVDQDITYAHLSKNISKYGDKLISIYGEVVDIEESDDGSLTYIHIMDYDYNSYTLYYLGSLDDVLEESEVYAYALPLDITKFENMNAQYTEAVVGAACYIEILGD